MVFQQRTISACIVVGDSRNLVILTDTNQTSNARSAPSNARARELLEFSRSTVDEIAATVGHDDASGLISKEQKVVERLLLAQSRRSHNDKFGMSAFKGTANFHAFREIRRKVAPQPLRDVRCGAGDAKRVASLERLWS